MSNGTASDGLTFTSTSLPRTYPLHFLHTTIINPPPTYATRTEVGVEVEVSRITDDEEHSVKSPGPWLDSPDGSGNSRAEWKATEADQEGDGDVSHDDDGREDGRSRERGAYAV